MSKKKVYYISNNLEIKQGFTGNINLNKVNEVVIEYKNNKIKVNSELVSDSKEGLDKQLNKMRIVKMAKDYDLKARWINNYLEIESKLDLWYVYENEYKKLVWVHKNRKGTKHDNHEHIQKVMYSNKEEDWKIILNSINSHDSYEFNRFSSNHIMHLFDMVKTNNVPKTKIC